MKTNTKRLLSMIMALVMILSLLPTMAFAAETTTIYLKAGDWDQASAWFQAWTWGGSTADAWVTFNDSDGDGVYEAEIPSDRTGLKLLRRGPSHQADSWDDTQKWNNTGDITRTGDYNCISITGWGETDYSWSNYVYTEPVIALPGSFNSWNTGNTMTVESGIGTITMDLAAGIYTFKVIKAGTWLGNATTISDTTEGITLSSTGGNITLNATGGTYTFTFAAASNTLSISAELSGSETDPVEEPDYTSPEIDGGSVTFNYWTSIPVSSVEISGSMNNWATGSYPMTKNADGIWSVTISDLYNGTYEYKIVVDGAWLTDPKNENTANDNSTFTITAGENKPVVLRDITLHFQDTQNWGCAYAHLWNADDYNTAWPGIQLEADMDYSGWYTCTTTVATDSIALNFNNGTGGEGYQTGDLTIAEIPETGCEYWFVPTSADSWWEGTFETTAPETYVKDVTATCEVTLHFKNTLNWDGVNGYAWTNTWPKTESIGAWPGTELNVDENGWYTVSFSAVYPTDDGVYAIFNTYTGMDESGNNTYSQTVDLYIDCTGQESVEKWIIPTGTQTDYLSYECNIYDAEPTETAQVNGVTYYSVAEAIANANGGVIALVNDSDAVLEIAADVTIDLAGHKLDNVTVADNYALTLIDTAGDDYTSTSCGVAYVKGTVNTLSTADGKNYLTVLNSDGQYSAHRYEVALTHVSLKPGSEALGYKAVIHGDDVVQAQVTGFGFNMSVAGGTTKTFTEESVPTDGQFTLRLQNIMAANGGEMEITASAFVLFGKQTAQGTENTTSMKEAIESVNTALAADSTAYTEAQITAIQTMLGQYTDATADWQTAAILGWTAETETPSEAA